MIAGAAANRQTSPTTDRGPDEADEFPRRFAAALRVQDCKALAARLIEAAQGAPLTGAMDADSGDQLCCPAGSGAAVPGAAGLVLLDWPEGWQASSLTVSALTEQ